MREELAADDITDREHARNVRPHLLVDDDLAAPPGGDPERLRVDAGERRATSNGDEDAIPLETLHLAAVLDVDANAVRLPFAADHARIGADLHTLFAKDAIHLLDDVGIHPGKDQIGRASCRERVDIAEGGVSHKLQMNMNR